MLKMNLLKILLSFLIIVQSNLALSVTPLKEGQSAPQAGLLFSQSEAQEIKRNLLELDFLKNEREIFLKKDELKTKEVENLKEINIILTGQKNELLAENEVLSKQSTAMSIAGFVIGVLVTGSIVYASRSK